MILMNVFELFILIILSKYARTITQSTQNKNYSTYVDITKNLSNVNKQEGSKSTPLNSEHAINLTHVSELPSGKNVSIDKISENMLLHKDESKNYGNLEKTFNEEYLLTEDKIFSSEQPDDLDNFLTVDEDFLNTVTEDYKHSENELELDDILSIFNSNSNQVFSTTTEVVTTLSDLKKYHLFIELLNRHNPFKENIDEREQFENIYNTTETITNLPLLGRHTSEFLNTKKYNQMSESTTIDAIAFDLNEVKKEKTNKSTLKADRKLINKELVETEINMNNQSNKNVIEPSIEQFLPTEETTEQTTTLTIATTNLYLGHKYAQEKSNTDSTENSVKFKAEENKINNIIIERYFTTNSVSEAINSKLLEEMSITTEYFTDVTQKVKEQILQEPPYPKLDIKENIIESEIEISMKNISEIMSQQTFNSNVTSVSDKDATKKPVNENTNITARISEDEKILIPYLSSAITNTNFSTELLNMDSKKIDEDTEQNVIQEKVEKSNFKPIIEYLSVIEEKTNNSEMATSDEKMVQSLNDETEINPSTKVNERIFKNAIKTNSNKTIDNQLNHQSTTENIIMETKEVTRKFIENHIETSTNIFEVETTKYLINTKFYLKNTNLTNMKKELMISETSTVRSAERKFLDVDILSNTRSRSTDSLPGQERNFEEIEGNKMKLLSSTKMDKISITHKSSVFENNSKKSLDFNSEVIKNHDTIGFIDRSAESENNTSIETKPHNKTQKKITCEEKMSLPETVAKYSNVLTKISPSIICPNTTSTNKEQMETESNASKLKENIPAFVSGKVFNHTAKFSVKIVNNGSTFFIPSDAYLVFKNQTNQLHITWKSKNDLNNNSLILNITTNYKNYIVNAIQLKILNKKQMLNLSKAVVVLPPLQTNIVNKSRIINLTRNIKIYLSNVEFLFASSGNQSISKKEISASTLVILKKFWQLELLIGSCALILILVICGYLIWKKYKNKELKIKNGEMVI